MVSDEGFWREKFGTLKARSAYGAAGRADVEPGGLGTAPAVRPLNPGDPNLGAERTVETELGFDQTLFNGRFSVDFAWFKAVTDDALLFVRNVPSNGFLASSLGNAGKIEKSGVEAAVSATLLEKENLGIKAELNLSTNQSKVLSLGGAPSFSIGNFG